MTSDGFSSNFDEAISKFLNLTTERHQMNNQYSTHSEATILTRSLQPSVSLSMAVESLKSDIFKHSAIGELKAFGQNLKSRPLTKNELRIFFASVGTFILQIPPGILAFSSRITDEWLIKRPYQALEFGSRILFAAVDEYGLNEMNQGLLPTHHQLYVDMAAHWGITEGELIDANYTLPSGMAFGSQVAEYYRTQSILSGLGFHLAVETTSTLEFGLYLKGFKKFASEYGLHDHDDPILNFLSIYIEVEASHREMGLEMTELYTQGQPDLVDQVRQGAFAFMESYGQLFVDLNHVIFDQPTITFPSLEI
jgi:Iron-containing redox enzyme